MRLKFENTDSKGLCTTSVAHVIVDGERVTVRPDSNGFVDDVDESVADAFDTAAYPSVTIVDDGAGECLVIMDSGDVCHRQASECPYHSDEEQAAARERPREAEAQTNDDADASPSAGDSDTSE